MGPEQLDREVPALGVVEVEDRHRWSRCGEKRDQTVEVVAVLAIGLAILYLWRQR